MVGSFSDRLAEKLAKKSLDFHCHGVGRFDFTEIFDIQLQEIECILASRHHKSILTLYLPKQNFDDFLFLMDIYSRGKDAGRFKHIAGIGLEGPLLASHGGTPETGVWNPSKYHWKKFAELGKKGLVYMIFSPDAVLDKTVSSSLFTVAPSTTWIAETLLDGGVLPNPGHFLKNDPIASAKALQDIFDVVAAWGQGAIGTDHLFNDMPLNFKHAWRTRADKAKRDEGIKALNLGSWTLSNLEEKLGPVPATIIRNSHKGLVKAAQNFDGEHVDLAVVKKAVELIGDENVMMMTDSIESKRLAGRNLHMMEGSTLLYQDEGIVAAGSQDVCRQINNMLSIGLTSTQIEKICGGNAANLLNYRNETINAQAHCI
jgi:N-acetylglucosamine-6-phosphate deacetylase